MPFLQPTAHSCFDGLAQSASLDSRGRADRFDCHHPAHRVRINGAESQRDMRPQRMTDKHRLALRAKSKLPRKCSNVGKISGKIVAPVLRPAAIAMSAQVGGDDMICLLQDLRQCVPTAAMVPASMNENKDRRARIWPFGIAERHAGVQEGAFYGGRGRPASFFRHRLLKEKCVGAGDHQNALSTFL